MESNPSPYESPDRVEPQHGYDELLHLRRIGLALYLLIPIDLLEWFMAPGRVRYGLPLLVYADFHIGWSLREGNDAWRSIVLARLAVGVGLTLALFLPTGNYAAAAAFCVAHGGAALVVAGRPSSVRQTLGLLITLLVPMYLLAAIIWALAGAPGRDAP